MLNSLNYANAVKKKITKTLIVLGAPVISIVKLQLFQPMREALYPGVALHVSGIGRKRHAEHRLAFSGGV
jgi:hypothetical protein